MQLTKTAIYAEIRSLTQEISTAPVSKERYQLLSQRLDHALQALHAWEATGKANKLFNSYLKERMINLYKHLEESRVQLELSRIQAGALSIKEGRITKKAFLLLKKRICQLEESYKGSIEERRIIAEAKMTLSQAEAQLKTPPLKATLVPLSLYHKHSARQKEGYLPGEVEALFEIAEMIFCNRNTSQTRARYYSLPLEQRLSVEAHLKRRGDSHVLLEQMQPPIPLIQALIATANELVGNDEGYPTQQQIQDLFENLSKLAISPQEESKIIPLTTNGLSRHV